MTGHVQPPTTTSWPRMRRKLVVVPPLQDPIQPCPGFQKKELADFKLDLLALCEFACAYCSSNSGNYLRIRRERFADLTEQQTGERTYPAEDPALMFFSPETIPNLEQQLARYPKTWGTGDTLVFSMLTDGFSPWLVQQGHTRTALDLLLENTSFRIRLLTKNATVGSKNWVRYFADHRDRVIVGLSIGTTDNSWARKIEFGTSPPSARLKALHRLQDAGVSTFGMLCPIFPDALAGGRLEQLVDEVRPSSVEHVWAEPFNDRNNWVKVRDGYNPGSPGWVRLTEMFEGKGTGWSEYATTLYARLRAKAEREGWLNKLRYLLYEHDIHADHVVHLGDLAGILLQSPKANSGRSKNKILAAVEARADVAPAHASTRGR